MQIPSGGYAEDEYHMDAMEVSIDFKHLSRLITDGDFQEISERLPPGELSESYLRDQGFREPVLVGRAETTEATLKVSLRVRVMKSYSQTVE